MIALLLIVLLTAISQAYVSPGILPPVKVKNAEGKIIGGTPAAPGQFPHQVHLICESPFGTWSCGGSLISKRWVLTAAHCAKDVTKATVRFGIDVNNPIRTIVTTRLIPYPWYNENTLNHDIAVIDLQTDVPLDSYINIINLARFTQMPEPFADRVARVSGFGYTANGGPVSSTLNYVDLTTISNSRCQEFYGNLIINSTICTTGNSQSTCFGDSGGPMYLRDEKDGIDIQIGVVSFVSSGGCTNGPAGFVRPHHYWSWINITTGIPIRY